MNTKRKELRHDRHTVSMLTDHMVFSPKYRGKRLVGDETIVSEAIIRNACKELDILRYSARYLAIPHYLFSSLCFEACRRLALRARKFYLPCVAASLSNLPLNTTKPETYIVREHK